MGKEMSTSRRPSYLLSTQEKMERCALEGHSWDRSLAIDGCWYGGYNCACCGQQTELRPILIAGEVEAARKILTALEEEKHSDLLGHLSQELLRVRPYGEDPQEEVRLALKGNLERDKLKRFLASALQVVPQDIMSWWRGTVEAPAGLLLAIAHGLATCGWRQDSECRWWQDGHWWLMSPADRKRARWVMPAPATLAEVERAAAAIPDERAPCVRLADSSTFEWVPFEGGYNFDAEDGRKIVIRFEEGAETGTIEWCSGKQELTYFPNRPGKKVPSAFIASILVLLPGARGDEQISRLLEAEDRKEASRVAAVRAAKARGVKGAITETLTGDLIASATEVARGGDIHPGRQPRRSWTPDGQERRFARWLKPKEWEQLVAQATPLPWRPQE